MHYYMKLTNKDEEEQIMFMCPDCGEYGKIDDDQFHGRVSIDIAGTEGTECDFHETINLAKVGKEVNWEEFFKIRGMIINYNG